LRAKGEYNVSAKRLIWKGGRAGGSSWKGKVWEDSGVWGVVGGGRKAKTIESWQAGQRGRWRVGVEIGGGGRNQKKKKRRLLGAINRRLDRGEKTLSSEEKMGE